MPSVTSSFILIVGKWEKAAKFFIERRRYTNQKPSVLGEFSVPVSLSPFHP